MDVCLPLDPHHLQAAGGCVPLTPLACRLQGAKHLLDTVQYALYLLTRHCNVVMYVVECCSIATTLT